MSGTCLTERRATVGADDFDVDVLIADIGVNLVERTQRREYEKEDAKGINRILQVQPPSVHILFGQYLVIVLLRELRCEVPIF